MIVFVSTGMNGLSVLFRAVNPQRGDYDGLISQKWLLLVP